MERKTVNNTKIWIKNSKVYRNHDLPASIEKHVKVWCKGVYHRSTLPAFIVLNGTKEWYLDGKRSNRKPFIYKSQKLTCVFPCAICDDGWKYYIIEGGFCSDNNIHRYYGQQNSCCSIQ